MKQYKKRLLPLLTAAVMVCSGVAGVTVQADGEEISPRAVFSGEEEAIFSETGALQAALADSPDAEVILTEPVETAVPVTEPTEVSSTQPTEPAETQDSTNPQEETEPTAKTEETTTEPTEVETLPGGGWLLDLDHPDVATLPQGGYTVKGEVVTGKFGIKPTVPVGELDGSGEIGTPDASLILKFTAQATFGTKAEDIWADVLPGTDPGRATICADTNLDGDVGAEDASAVLAYVAKCAAGTVPCPLGVIYYCAGDDGALLNGFIKDGGSTYYAGADHRLKIGWQTINKKKYYFNDEAVMQKNRWIGIRYVGKDGAAVTGWQTIGGNTYFFDKDADRQKGLLKDKDSLYFLDENGIRVSGWHDAGGKTYYFKPSDYKAVTGWQTIDGEDYYFNADSTMARNTSVDGLWLNEEGKVQASEMYLRNRERAQEVFASYGTSPGALFSYVRATNHYKFMEPTKSLRQIEAIGWLYHVDYAMTHYYTVCYYMAAKMDFLLHEAGYECRIVHSVHRSGEHYWNQVRINGAWVNYDCTNGYNAYSWNRIIAAGNYTFLGYVRPVYS